MIGAASWAYPRLVPAVSLQNQCLSSLPSIPPPARRAMSGVSLDGSCLKISSITNPQPGVQARHPGQGWTVIATISIAYLVFLSSQSSRAWERAVLTAQTAYPARASHEPASGNVGLGLRTYSASSANNPAKSHADRQTGQAGPSGAGAHPGRPRAIVGSRSSGVPGRPGPGTGGSSQKVC